MPCENPDTCPLLHRIKILEEESGHNKASHEKIYDRLNAIERENSATSVQYDQIMANLKDLKDDVSEIKDRPVKRFDAVQMALISAVISAMIGFAIKFFGG